MSTAHDTPADDTQARAEKFDLTAWLAHTDQDDITDRSHRTLTVYRHPGHIDEALQRVQVLEQALQAEVQAHRATAPQDLAMGEAPEPEPQSPELDAARAQLSALLEEHALHLTVYALTAQESRDAVADTEESSDERMYGLVAKAVRLPGNVQASVQQWKQIHHAIGQAQLNRLEEEMVATFRRDTGAEVTALFSQRS